MDSCFPPFVGRMVGGVIVGRMVGRCDGWVDVKEV